MEAPKKKINFKARHHLLYSPKNYYIYDNLRFYYVKHKADKNSIRISVSLPEKYMNYELVSKMKDSKDPLFDVRITMTTLQVQRDRSEDSKNVRFSKSILDYLYTNKYKYVFTIDSFSPYSERFMDVITEKDIAFLNDFYKSFLCFYIHKQIDKYNIKHSECIVFGITNTPININKRIGLFRKKIIPLYEKLRSISPTNLSKAVSTYSQILESMNIPVTPVSDDNLDEIIRLFVNTFLSEKYFSWGLQYIQRNEDESYLFGISLDKFIKECMETTTIISKDPSFRFRNLPKVVYKKFVTLPIILQITGLIITIVLFG